MRQGSITHRNIYVTKVFSIRGVSTNMERKYKESCIISRSIKQQLDEGSFRGVFETLSKIFDENFFKNIQLLLKKAPSQMFDRVLNTGYQISINVLINFNPYRK